MSDTADQELDDPDGDADVDEPVFDAPGLDDAVFQDDGDEREQERERSGARALEQLLGPAGSNDLDEGMFEGPLYWPSIPAADIEQEFRELRAWVQGLLERFEHLDHTVIPTCWWRHNSHVEALQALRDHERISYSESSPAQAATHWHREFHFVEMRLREWTSGYACSKDEHRPGFRSIPPIDQAEWTSYLAGERRRREDAELGLGGSGPAGRDD
jgi:hypothetical protein